MPPAPRTPRTTNHLGQPGGISRRFVTWLLGTSLGALVASAVYPLARFVTPPPVPEAPTDQVEAGSVDDPVLLDHGFKIVRFGAEPVILVRVAADDFRAFSATCTHLDCIVTYRQDRSLIWCYCHDGIYDLTGKNIGGPPPRPLTPYVVHVVPESAGPDRLVVAKG